MIFSTRIIQNPVPDSHDDVMEHMMDLDDPFDPPFSRPIGNPFDILHPGFAERAAAGFFGGRPQVTHPREVRQIPIEAKESNSQTISSVRVLLLKMLLNVSLRMVQRFVGL
jgi:hypothetical protein